MIKIAIIEDEVPAGKKNFAGSGGSSRLPQVIAEIDRVEVAIPFLQTSGGPYIFDIELLDGNAFDAFTTRCSLCPIIFTTAYDDFG
jgi:hypothetical protein